MPESVDRNHAVLNLHKHLKELGKDLSDLRQVARTWSANSKGQILLKHLSRDYTQFEAHVMALIMEVEHMNTMRRHLTGESGPSAHPKSRQPQPSVKPSEVPPEEKPTETLAPFPQWSEKDFQIEEPQHEEASSEPEPDDDLGFDLHVELGSDPEPETAPRVSAARVEPAQVDPTAPPPDEDTAARESRLTQVAKGIPPHILKKLRNQGLE